ncbi:type II toxin-antitoxin system Phd/YefM family antitoxin [Sulfurovum sp.]|uniref:type II toxin-antitoxin system Phd/YefM family antitoxin n=1 Tax=Sulfurovum sp. TaxID=1969726 RepID=UPI0025D95D0E|nr:type II toxin-antitoxin system Phd/YefM family antitoxin [Sulfurovum sp.]
MTQILANYTASISELKKSPSSVIEDAGGEAVAILNHNKPSAYLVPSALYEKMMDIIDDYDLAKEVRERLDYDEDDLIEVSIDDL